MVIVAPIIHAKVQRKEAMVTTASERCDHGFLPGQCTLCKNKADRRGRISRWRQV